MGEAAVIDHQLDSYPAQSEFCDRVLGLLALARESVALLAIETHTPAPAIDERTIDCALGVISLARTLHAVLTTCTDPAPAADDARMPESSYTTDWLR